MSRKTIAQLFDLTGKGAIVTGGGAGIGKGIALRLGEAGAGVMITNRNMDTAKQAVEEIRAGGGKAQAIYADAINAADAENVVKATMDAFGSIDILVNNVGLRLWSSFANITEETWDRMLDVNLKSMFFYSRAAAREMIKGKRGGKIINISSAGALRPHGCCAHYDASKGGIVSLTQALALELAPHNIQVNAIAPGATATPGAMETGKAYAEALKQFEHPVLNVWTAMEVPWHHFAEPDDIAKVALFLGSAAADHMTGTLLLVDGGRLLL